MGSALLVYAWLMISGCYLSSYRPKQLLLFASDWMFIWLGLSPKTAFLEKRVCFLALDILINSVRILSRFRLRLSHEAYNSVESFDKQAFRL